MGMGARAVNFKVPAPFACVLAACLASLVCLAGCKAPPVPVLEFEQVCPAGPEGSRPGIPHIMLSGWPVYTWPADDSQDYPLGLTDGSSPWLLEGIWEDVHQVHRYCFADGNCTETYTQWLRMSAVVQEPADCGLRVWVPLHDIPSAPRFPDSWHEVAQSLPRQSLMGLTGKQAEVPARPHYSVGHAIHLPSPGLDLHLCPHPRCPKLRPTIAALGNRLLVAGTTTSTDGREWYLVNTGGKNSLVWVDPSHPSHVDIRILPRSTRLLDKHAKEGAAGFLHCFYLAADSGTPHLRLPAPFTTRGTHAICLVDNMGEPLTTP